MKREEAVKFLDAAGQVDARKIRRSIGSRKASRGGTKRAMWMGGKPMARRKLVISQRRSAIMTALHSALEIVIAPQGDPVLAN